MLYQAFSDAGANARKIRQLQPFQCGMEYNIAVPASRGL
jgi:hypothetical protein